MVESNKNIIHDLLNGKYSNFDPIANLISYNYRKISYALPINASENLRQHIAAAIIKYQKPDLCYEEIIENLPKSNFSDSVSISQNELICFNIANNTDICVNLINDMKNMLKKKHNFSTGELLYLLSMCRLKESFKSAILLNNNGFFVETIPIIRLVYEQLCWAIYVIDETDDEAIKKNSTTKNTRYLKKKISAQYGKIYDYLSKQSHLAPSTIGKYLEEGPIPESVVAKGRSGKKAAENVEIILIMYKIFVEVFIYGVKHFHMDEDNRQYYMEFLNSQISICALLYKCYSNQSGLSLLDENRL